MKCTLRGKANAFEEEAVQSVWSTYIPFGSSNLPFLDIVDSLTVPDNVSYFIAPAFRTFLVQELHIPPQAIPLGFLAVWVVLIICWVTPI